MVQSTIDASSEKYLRGKYAIVGVGETGYTRGSGRPSAEVRVVGPYGDSFLMPTAFHKDP